MSKIAISPRFCETDANGHINNVAFAAWFEAGRLSYLESLDNRSNSSNSVWLLASVSMDYLLETFYGVDVEVEVVAESLGQSSMKLQCHVRRADDVVLKGIASVVYVGVDNKPRLIPDVLRSVIECDINASRRAHGAQEHTLS